MQVLPYFILGGGKAMNDRVSKALGMIVVIAVSILILTVLAGLWWMSVKYFFL